MGRKGITMNLKATSTKGEVMWFTTTPEAARELGFSEFGVRKAYHAGRDRIGECRLEWLEPELEQKEDEKVVERIRRMKEALYMPNCYCGKELSGMERVKDGFRIMRLGKDGNPAEEYSVKSV